MKWKFVEPLESEDSINDFERSVRYFFPKGFRECVLKYNGGYPTKCIFDTSKSKDRMIKSLLSFNRTDIESIWEGQEWISAELSGKYVAFAIDNFGNLICFDKSDDSVVFVNHEDSSVEKIADTFSAFIEALRPET